jgi:TonB family protein
MIRSPMTPAQALSVESIWQQWERRIVNARFPLLRYLGGSKHSAFYLTEYSGAKAAIKLVPAGTPRTAAQVACWKIAARLSHPNLVRILEAGLWHADQEQDMCFAVMEYCDESLADLLRQRRLTPGEAREVLKPTLGVLKYLHSQGLLHGQIKPAHLLASGDQLKLSCDTIHRNGEGHPSAIESPYDAPEKSAGTISLSGDVWSLGITLFEALTGHLPGGGMNGNAKAAEKLPPPFDAIVTGCMARDREQRLSLGAIRAILDKPVKEPAAEPKSDGESNAKSGSNLIVLPANTTAKPEAPPKMEVLRPAPAAEKISAITPPTTEIKAQRAKLNLRKLLDIPKPALAAGLIVAVLIVVFGLRLAHKTSQAAPLTTGHATHRSVAAPRPATPVPPAALAASRSAGVLQQVLPQITPHAQNSIHGTVKVKVLAAVDANGRVSRAKVASRGPSSYFVRQALESARQWTFTPAIRDGRLQSSEWTIHFEFRRSGTTATARQARD